VLSVVFFVARPPELGRTALGVGFGLSVLALWAVRCTIRSVHVPRPEGVLVLGGGPACDLAARAIDASGTARFTLLGRIGDEGDAGCAAVQRLGGWGALAATLDSLPVDRLLFASAPPPGWDIGPVVEARVRGVQALPALEFAEGLTGEVVESEVGPAFITESTTQPYGRVSRLADVALSIALLVLLAPVIAIVALLVLVSSGPPVLFRQERAGRGGAPYRCWKFRTMRGDAEAGGPAWSPPGDPRVTRMGRFLRRWRLDELPQLWNVLRGDMAFVGPRPEQPYFVERLKASLPHYGLRHVVRPGLTGWAQVRHPYGSSEDDARGKLRLDLFYIKHRSPWLDLVILFDTVRVVLAGRGR
jgi:exopolysaccharide biosynthesis polyprenyl glycosylphosphotransferase